MPIMVRPSKGIMGNSKKIAYAILGTPSNLQTKAYISKKVKKQLDFEETRRVRGAI